MVSIGAILYSFTQQTFNDAIWFLEEAEKLDGNETPFVYWKYCTWSIIASAVFMESYLKSHIKSIIEDADPSILEQYEDSNLGFFKNVDFIDATFDSNIKDVSDDDWKNIDRIISVRNTIVHYNKVNISSYTTIENARQGIKACRSFFKKLNNVIGIDSSKYHWIDKIQSENYDAPK